MSHPDPLIGFLHADPTREKFIRRHWKAERLHPEIVCPQTHLACRCPVGARCEQMGARGRELCRCESCVNERKEAA